jgi:hypothetical protein
MIAAYAWEMIMGGTSVMVGGGSGGSSRGIDWDNASDADLFFAVAVYVCIAIILGKIFIMFLRG